MLTFAAADDPEVFQASNDVVICRAYAIVMPAGCSGYSTDDVASPKFQNQCNVVIVRSSLHRHRHVGYLQDEMNHEHVVGAWVLGIWPAQCCISSKAPLLTPLLQLWSSQLADSCTYTTWYSPYTRYAFHAVQQEHIMHSSWPWYGRCDHGIAGY